LIKATSYPFIIRQNRVATAKRGCWMNEGGIIPPY
jgi:hypothetical protein